MNNTYISTKRSQSRSFLFVVTVIGSMIIPSLRTVLAFAPRSSSLVARSAVARRFPSQTASAINVVRWMNADGQDGNVTAEKTEEEKAAIKAAREARK